MRLYNAFSCGTWAVPVVSNILSGKCMRQWMTQRSEETVLCTILLTFSVGSVCVPLTSPSWAARLEAKHVSLTLLFYFLCQYCWLWGYRVFKGWATSRPYLNVRLKLFWKAPWSASFCVFHAPFGRNRRQRRETKKERDPYYLHFDVPSEM